MWNRTMNPRRNIRNAPMKKARQTVPTLFLQQGRAGISMKSMPVILATGMVCLFVWIVPAIMRPSVIAKASESNMPPAGLSEKPTHLAPFFSPTVLRWEARILAWSEGYGLDPNLVATVIQIESCGNSRVSSPAGAQGLFQVMPFHFSAGENPLDPETNARRGLEYLATGLLASEGRIDRALAGYNGGHGRIPQDPDSWPAETRRYAYWGEGIYADARNGAAVSERHIEWMTAGGAWLCGKAELAGES